MGRLGVTFVCTGACPTAGSCSGDVCAKRRADRVGKLGAPARLYCPVDGRQGEIGKREGRRSDLRTQNETRKNEFPVPIKPA